MRALHTQTQNTSVTTVAQTEHALATAHRLSPWRYKKQASLDTGLWSTPNTECSYALASGSTDEDEDEAEEASGGELPFFSSVAAAVDGGFKASPSGSYR